MGFSAKQVKALRRNLDQRYVRTREANGREFSYIEGWYAISEANRIFGFDGWSRETVESRCVLARENRGAFLAVYTARVRISVQAGVSMIIREGHGSGEGRGGSPGEVHDTALKAAETDATKRALATFGKPFGLALYGIGKSPSIQPTIPIPSTQAEPIQRFGFHPDDTTPIPRPSRYYGRRPICSIDRPTPKTLSRPKTDIVSPAACPERARFWFRSDRQEPTRRCRAQAATRQGAFKVRSIAAVPDLWSTTERPAPSSICTTARHWPEGQR
jgi:DNA recombination protein Rad52